MPINACVTCPDFPCGDVRHDAFRVPDVDLDPAAVRIVLISESAAPAATDDYYAGEQALFAQTTLLAFQDAGAPVNSMADILRMGVYLTTAVKCAKTAYAIETGTIKQCATLLERELALFPHVVAYLLMGDVAIKAVNEVARRAGEGRVIPAGSTYKIRGQTYTWRGARALPSYLQAGPSFFIEKSKRQMIAQDIATALSLLG
jgi:uracil-DNA glycosylase